MSGMVQTELIQTGAGPVGSAVVITLRGLAPSGPQFISFNLLMPFAVNGGMGRHRMGRRVQND